MAQPIVGVLTRPQFGLAGKNGFAHGAVAPMVAEDKTRKAVVHELAVRLGQPLATLFQNAGAHEKRNRGLFAARCLFHRMSSALRWSLTISSVVIIFDMAGASPQLAAVLWDV
jgi:hypothetical protein